ncbi:hypothetical protein J6590_085478 [Homalodisca vitripennis]|nr:hypothetical protein J6590_085478 [Homalodisca vitripennis]
MRESVLNSSLFVANYFRIPSYEHDSLQQHQISDAVLKRKPFEKSSAKNSSEIDIRGHMKEFQC